MSKKPWIKNGKPILVNGSPTICEECPCGSYGECEDRVSATVAELIASGYWQLVGSYSSSFMCAQWAETSDSESSSSGWRLVYPSQGTLLMAVQHLSYVSLEGDPVPFISATVLYNLQTGTYRTIGCRCAPDSTDYVCKHTYTVLDGYDIAGQVSVYVPEDGSDSDSNPDWDTYSILDVCRFDACSMYRTWLLALHAWYGGELHGEGYIDWWDGGHPEYPYDLLELYDREKHLMAWVWQSVDCQWHYLTLNCECTGLSGGYLSDTVMIHDFEGICSLEDECILEIMCHMRWYLDLQDENSGEDSSSSTGCPQPRQNAIWEEVGLYNGKYTCPVWEQVEGQWTMVQPPTGKLVMGYDISLPNTEWGPSPTPEIQACGKTFLSAGVIRNKQTGQYKLFGCECHLLNQRECDTLFVQYDDYAVGGMLSPSQEEGRSCDVNLCDATMMYISLMHTVHDGTTLRGEGIIEEFDQYGNYSYTPYKAGLQWGGEDSDSDSGNQGYFMWVPCECICPIDWVALDDETLVIDASGICDEECQDYFALRASARKHGWEWHEDGIWTYKYRVTYQGTTTYSDWWRIPQSNNNHGIVTGGNICRAVAIDSANSMAYCLSCNCSITTKSLVLDDMYTTVPLGYWKYLEQEGGCDCLDVRELIIDYPDDLGVEDVSYSNDTIFRAVRTVGGYDPMDPPRDETTITVAGTKFGDSYQNMYLEKRAFCVAYKVLVATGATRIQLGMITPEGSPQNGYWGYNSTFYNTIEFIGHAQPFTHNTTGGMNWWWAGYSVEWVPYYDSMDMSYIVSSEWLSGQGCYVATFPSQSESYARELAGKTKSTVGITVTNNGVTGGGYGWKAGFRVVPADYSTSQRCSSACSFNSQTGYWEARPTVNNTGVQRTSDNGTWEKLFVYREQWIDSNEGIVCVGQSPVASITIPGYNGASDRTVTAQIVDTDMHGCPDHDVDWLNDSESV